MLFHILLQLGLGSSLRAWPKGVSQHCDPFIYDTDDCCWLFYTRFPLTTRGWRKNTRQPPVESYQAKPNPWHNYAAFACKDNRDNMWPESSLRSRVGFRLYCNNDRRIAKYLGASWEHLTLEEIKNGAGPRQFWKARCDAVSYQQEIMLRGYGNDCVDSNPATRDFIGAIGRALSTEVGEVFKMTMTDRTTGRTYAAESNFIQWPESVVPGHVYKVCSTSAVPRPVPLTVAFTQGED